MALPGALFTAVAVLLALRPVRVACRVSSGGRRPKAEAEAGAEAEVSEEG